METGIEGLRERARALRAEVSALRRAARDPRTPWVAKVLAAAAVAYALSPIDLIPDVIPVLGYLDDLLLVPAALALAIRMIPEEVMDQARREAAAAHANGTSRRWGVAVVIVLLWLAGLVGLVRLAGLVGLVRLVVAIRG